MNPRQGQKTTTTKQQHQRSWWWVTVRQQIRRGKAAPAGDEERRKNREPEAPTSRVMSERHRTATRPRLLVVLLPMATCLCLRRLHEAAKLGCALQIAELAVLYTRSEALLISGRKLFWRIFCGSVLLVFFLLA